MSKILDSAGRLAVAALAVTAAACAKPPLTDEELSALDTQGRELAASFESAAPSSTGVVVKLAFGPEADLDLYVTDPLLDTVYFARHESRTGGIIVADVRCDTDGPRIEEIRFADPWPGRYRVGVDHPRRCDGESSPAPAAYALTVVANGKTHKTHGIVDLEYFEPIVLEFDVDKGGS